MTREMIYADAHDFPLMHPIHAHVHICVQNIRHMIRCVLSHASIRELAAATKLLKSGCGRSGRDVNSG